MESHMYNLKSKVEMIVFIAVCQSDLNMHKCCCGSVDDLLCRIGMFCDEESDFACVVLDMEILPLIGFDLAC